MSLALALAPAPAAAQDADAAHDLLRACLGAAETPADEHACRGAYARECSATLPGGETTIGIAACAATEAEAWDRLLNETWADLMLIARRQALGAAEAGAEPLPLEDMLRDAQRAWLAFRDLDCDQEYAIWGDGSHRQVAGAWCVLDRTATRTLELRGKREQMAWD